MIFHDSFDAYYRSPFGAVLASSKVNIKIFADCASSVTLRIWTDENGESLLEMSNCGDDCFSLELSIPNYPTLLWYSFIVHYPSGESCLYGSQEDGFGGPGKEYASNPCSYQITVYKKTEMPKWFSDGIMYQIFPDRFYRGSDFEARCNDSGKGIVNNWNDTPRYIKNDSGEVVKWEFYGGTLKGIEEKLDYLKDLGIGCIYLNPIFKARSNHRYDTADYMKVDPLLGDEESFVSLCNHAKEKGIRIILDGVFSHTGQDSIYFEEGSPYRDWYSFNDDGSYKCWWGVKDLPEVDETNPSYLDYICGEQGVISKWIQLGASGFRLDVADELPDSFIAQLRRRLKKEKPDAVLIGEVWEDASNKFSHGERRKYLLGDELDGVMNYPLRSMLIDYATGVKNAFEFLRLFTGLSEHYPKESLYYMMNLLSSHDRIRILSVLKSKQKLQMLYTLLYSLPGVPCIYYGDESSLEGETDPLNRASYPWDNQDDEMIEFFKNLGRQYHNHSALQSGDFKPLFLNSEIVSFIRQNENEKVLVLANRSEQTQIIEFEDKNYELPPLRTIFTNI